MCITCTSLAVGAERRRELHAGFIPREFAARRVELAHEGTARRVGTVRRFMYIAAALCIRRAAEESEVTCLAFAVASLASNERAARIPLRVAAV